MTLNPAARSRVALAILALSGYAACADQPAAPQHTAWADLPKHEARDAADPTHGLDQHLDDIRIRLTHRHERATRGQAKRSEVRPETPPPGDDIWHALATCESGMRQDAVGEGRFLSYFQWLPATFHSVGGEGDPRDTPYDVQVTLAQRLQARSGWGQWPRCSKKLGLR